MQALREGARQRIQTRRERRRRRAANEADEFGVSFDHLAPSAAPASIDNVIA